MLASVDRIAPGVPFTLGVFLWLEPGWHVYWKFPGDAGLPPTITWQLPEEWVVGEIQWPLPQRFTEKGPLTTYGYSDSVLLMVTVTPPNVVTPLSPVALAARINWLVCHDECIPGKADVELRLPVADVTLEERPDNTTSNAHIDQWQNLLPRRSESALATVTAALANADSTGKKANVTLDISTVGTDLTIVDWFPAPASDCAVKDIVRSAGAGRSVVTFALQSYQRPISEIGIFESLLICEDSYGKRHGLILSTAFGSK